MDKILITVFGLIFLTCYHKNDVGREKATTELSDEYAHVGIGDTLKGDYLLYSGITKVQDESKVVSPPIYIELVLDLDNRFAIRHRFPASKVETDTAEFQFMGMLSNKASGHWKDVGQKLELEFEEGMINFFDLQENNGIVEIINNNSARIDKTAEAIWIWKTECRKKTDR